MEKRFAIFGSCVTRDAFEFGQPNPGKERVSIYLARTTVNSCLSTPVPFKNLFAAERQQKFEERCVIDDIFKRHFDALREKPFDYLLLDLIDERHPIISVDGSYLCYSVPFLRMAEAFKLDPAKFERRSPRDPSLIEETLANLPRFVERLSAIVDPSHIILHEAYWATEFIAATGERQVFPNAADYRARQRDSRSLLRAPQIGCRGALDRGARGSARCRRETPLDPRALSFRRNLLSQLHGRA